MIFARSNPLQETAMTLQLPKVARPAHVPEHLVRPFPFIYGTTTDKDPFGELAAEVHRGPEIFWAEHAYPGGTPAWVVRRTEDLRAIYFDTEHFSNKGYAPFPKAINASWSILPTEFDPPQHQLYRSMVNPVFTPRAMEKLEGKIHGYAREYIASFRDKGACEFMADFAFEFPIKVFTELMGLPQDRTKQFLEWEMNMLHNHDMSKIAAATQSVVDYLYEEIEDRRRNPADDLITYGVNAKIEGRSLTEDELIGFCFNLFIGGLDTVSTHIGLQFQHLAEHPADQQQLRANPDLIPDAVEELMRAYPAVSTFRNCVKECEIKGVKFMPGDMVLMSTTLAGLDPQEFENPHEVRFDRKPRHVSFAYGPHICVGMHLARREMRIAMKEFLAGVPQFKLPDGYKVQSHLGMIQPVELPLQWAV